MTFKQFVNEHYGKPEPSVDTREMFDKDLMDRNLKLMKYKQALEHVKKHLEHALNSEGGYDSAHAHHVVNKAVEKFNLTPEERRDLEVDLFDWENEDNDEMHDDAFEAHQYRHSPSNMKGFIDKMFKSGRQHTKTYQEFKVPVQK